MYSVYATVRMWNRRPLRSGVFKWMMEGSLLSISTLYLIFFTVLLYHLDSWASNCFGHKITSRKGDLLKLEFFFSNVTIFNWLKLSNRGVFFPWNMDQYGVWQVEKYICSCTKCSNTKIIHLVIMFFTKNQREKSQDRGQTCTSAPNTVVIS